MSYLLPWHVCCCYLGSLFHVLRKRSISLREKTCLWIFYSILHYTILLYSISLNSTFPIFKWINESISKYSLPMTPRTAILRLVLNAHNQWPKRLHFCAVRLSAVPRCSPVPVLVLYLQSDHAGLLLAQVLQSVGQGLPHQVSANPSLELDDERLVGHPQLLPVILRRHASHNALQGRGGGVRGQTTPQRAAKLPLKSSCWFIASRTIWAHSNTAF